MIKSNNLTLIQWILAFNFIWSKNTVRNPRLTNGFESTINPVEYLLQSKQVLSYHLDKMMISERSLLDQNFVKESNTWSYTPKINYLRHPGSKKKNKSGKLKSKQFNTDLAEGRYQLTTYGAVKERATIDPILLALHLISEKAVVTQQSISKPDVNGNNLCISSFWERYFGISKFNDLSPFDVTILCLIIITSIFIVFNCLVMVNLVCQFYK